MLKKNDRFLGLYSNFDPKLIILQIICMQLVFYGGLSVFFMILDFTFGLQMHIGQYFHFTTFETDTTYGLVAALASGLNIPLMIGGLTVIVEKANKVLDFVTTVYFYHYIICVLYNGALVSKFSWLMVNGICMVVNIVVGEYVCIRLEQQEIRLFENLMTNSRSESKGPSKKELRERKKKQEKEQAIEKIELKSMTVSV